MDLFLIIAVMTVVILFGGYQLNRLIPSGKNLDSIEAMIQLLLIKVQHSIGSTIMEETLSKFWFRHIKGYNNDRVILSYDET